ncbi:MAG: phosphoglycerate kinase, partial [Actinomycetota bacterium]
MASVKKLSSLDFAGKRVVLRADLNVPLKDGRITDDGRIKASLPTINFLIDAGASILVIAHLGRPKGERKSELSLRPVASRLGELLGRDVNFAENVDDAIEATGKAKPGEITCLENIRFETAETSKVEEERFELARKLAYLGEIYVGDGFGAVHRKHASVFELASLMPHAAGFLVAKESEILERLT